MSAGSGTPVAELDQTLFSPAPAPFDVSVERSNGRVVLRARGELDLSTAPTLEHALDTLDGGASEGLLDMSEVTFMDSSGLRLLIIAAEQARDEGRRLSIVPSSAVSLVVEQVGLRAALPIVDD
jgi:anti-sigma B factor antagonist